MRMKVSKAFRCSVQRAISKLSRSKPPIVAIRANDLCFMGILRTIENAGFESICVHFTWKGAGPWLSEKSRHWTNTIEITNPAEDPTKAATELAFLGNALLGNLNQKSLLVPSSDTAQKLLFEYEDKLGLYFNMYGAPNFDSFRYGVTHKGEFFKSLHEHLPDLCPETTLIQKYHSSVNFDELTRFPYVIKPAAKDFTQSFYRLNNGKKAITVSNINQAKITIRQLLKTQTELILQEKIPFSSVDNEVPVYCYFDRNSELRMIAAGRKNLIYPSEFGTAIVLELTKSEFLREHAQRVGKLLRWSGPLMIEFIKDARSKKFKIIEVNTRPWLFHDFYRQHGLDFIGSALREHCDFQNGTKLFASWLNGRALVEPDETISRDKKTVHLDILSYVEHLATNAEIESFESEKIIASIKSLGSNITFAQGSKDDLDPYQAGIRFISDRYNLNPEPFIGLLS